MSAGEGGIAAVAAGTGGAVQNASEESTWVHSATAQGIAGVCAFLAIAISLHQVNTFYIVFFRRMK